MLQLLRNRLGLRPGSGEQAAPPGGTGKGKKTGEPQTLLRTGRPGEEPAGQAGGTQFCPVCGARLGKGVLIQSSVFPSFNGQERIMHIKGCPHCLRGSRERTCPVCKGALKPEEVLIARMYEGSRKPHIHILGCSRCYG